MNQSLRRAFVGFHLTLAGVVLVQSVSTAFSAFAILPGPNWPLAILATAESIGALLFFFPATMRAGGVILCVVFLLALVAHGLAGEAEFRLLVYLAGAIFVMIHGSGYLDREQPNTPQHGRAAV